MALITERASKLFLRTLPLIQAKRFRGKINLRRPRALHFEKAKFLKFAEPFFPSFKRGKEPVELCRKGVVIETKDEDDNPLQRIIARELFDHIKKSRMMVFFHLNSMDADNRFKAFVAFKKQNMLFKNYGRKTIQMAVQGTPYEIITSLFVSHTMLVVSPEPDAKKVLQIVKKFPQLIFLAAVLENKFVSKDEFVKYSLVGNLQTARAGLVQTLEGIGGQFVNHLTGNQNTLISHLENRIKQLQVDDK